MNLPRFGKTHIKSRREKWNKLLRRSPIFTTKETGVGSESVHCLGFISLIMGQAVLLIFGHIL